jgi:acetyl esterase/lipase
MEPHPQTHIYKVAGDHPIRADVYRASGAGRRPGLLWLHGGAMISGDRSRLRPQELQRYLSAGYTVVSADYRLAPETLLDGILEDVCDAYGWMRQHGPDELGIDPDRTAIVGHSAGGYLTLMAGARLGPRPRALVSFYGYGDITSEWANQPDPYYNTQPAISQEEALRGVYGPVISTAPSPERKRFYHYCRQRGMWATAVVGWDPTVDPADAVRYSPRFSVTADYPPTLLLHGDQDTDVPHEQSAWMARELARHSVNHQFISLPGAPHGFDKPEYLEQPEVIKALAVVGQFLCHHLDRAF